MNQQEQGVAGLLVVTGKVLFTESQKCFQTHVQSSVGFLKEIAAID
jgi:hypothetical protein